MADESTNNAKKEKFIGLLHELFQLNQPELDFGLYRIMHAKSGQIKAFIQNDLASEIDEAFADSGDDKIAELKANYEQARAQAVEFGIPDPDSNPKVKEAKEAYDAARDNGDDPSDIYDHLYRFFSRYYDKGDFLSRRYHVGENESRAAPYAVPYDGREVYLHWANKDQYYIKSSEYLSNFSFDLSEAVAKERKRQGAVGQEGLDFGSPDTETPIKVTLQLVDATEGAHNNVKENQARFFIIHADKPVEVRPSVSAEDQTEGHELIINFEYRPDPEKSGQESGWQKKRLQEAESVILETLKSEQSLLTFHDALAFQAPTEKQKDRTLLAKYLTSYTARNTMDYFIHKDLGGFLRRELDFYIKNEIMRLDDISSNDIAGITHSLKKIAALRSIARQIIDFLAQLENFQKNLWLKKKFVTEVNYCMTLDRVPESFYQEILDNDEQWQEWSELGFIGDSKPSIETLQRQPYMMLDTALYGETFKERLLAEIDDLDKQCKGVLIHSENYQALRFLSNKYQNKVQCIYIDPPYNTGSDRFPYKDGYQHSSWMSMLNQTTPIASSLLTDTGTLLTSIGIDEHAHISQVVGACIGEGNKLGELVWEKGRKNDSKRFSIGHDYILVWAKNRVAIDEKVLPWREPKPGIKPIIDEYVRLKVEYGDDYSKMSQKLKEFYASLDDGHPSKKYARAWHIDHRGIWRDNNISWPGGGGPKYELLHPVTGEPCKVPDAGWRFIETTMLEKIADGFVEFRADHTQPPIYKSYIYIDGGSFEDENDGVGQVMGSVFYRHSQPSNDVIKNLFSERVFENPKDHTILARLLDYLTHKGDIILDYFAGSGSTGHAVIDALNTNRNYLLIEAAEYFDDIMLKRIKKIVYSKAWDNGRPSGADGQSHFLKYVRLESYEDSINNIRLEKTAAHPNDSSKGKDSFYRHYLLNYFLNIEARASGSLLNIQQFQNPTEYKLMVKKPGAESQAEVNVDLVETFNWLIGLEVAFIDKSRTYDAVFEREHDPELPEDQHTRLKVKRFKEDERGSHWFRVIEGYVRRTPGSDANKEKVMVIWRKLTDDPEHDAAALEALLSKYRVNQSDSEFDKIYINGPHGLNLSGQAKAKLLSLEETFMARMWEDTDGAMH